jgi:hypothetical protein
MQKFKHVLYVKTNKCAKAEMGSSSKVFPNGIFKCFRCQVIESLSCYDFEVILSEFGTGNCSDPFCPLAK